MYQDRYILNILSINNNYFIIISKQSYYYQFTNNLGAFKGYGLQGNNAERQDNCDDK